MSSEETFFVNDPVHGSIELRGKALRLIIDSKEFQRLRKIKQLGGASYVYPGATHTRFEHSIGVCYIASELMKSLRKDETAKDIIEKAKSDPEPKIDYEKCVTVAALCHDLGHGPYSHLYDAAIENKHGKKDEQQMKHEFRSVEILKKIRRDSDDLQIEISDSEKEIIGNMITFSEHCKDVRKEKGLEDLLDMSMILQMATENQILKKLNIPKDAAFLYEIVANGFTGIDVDKMDYFIRDGHGLGLSSSFNWRRYIQTLRVNKPYKEFDNFSDKEITRLCSREKEAHELYELFHIRNKLHRQAYRHKTTIAVESMMKLALLEADKDLFVKAEGSTSKPLSILDAWQDVGAFLLLCDSVEDIIMHPLQSVPEDEQLTEDGIYVDGAFYWKTPPEIPKTCPDGISNARRIFQDIAKRKLIKFLGEGEKKIVDALSQRWKETPLIKEKVTFSYGMKEKNPVQLHYFYDKHNPEVAYNLSSDEVSKMLPDKFWEEKTMFYYQPENGVARELQKKFLRKKFKEIKQEIEREQQNGLPKIQKMKTDRKALRAEP